MGASWCGCSPEEPSAGRGLPQPNEKLINEKQPEAGAEGFVDRSKRHMSAAGRKSGNERVGGAGRRRGLSEGEALRERWQLDAVHYFAKEGPVDRVQAYLHGENAVRRGGALLSPIPHKIDCMTKGEGVLSEPTTDTGRLTSEPSEAEYARKLQAAISRGSDGSTSEASGRTATETPIAHSSAADSNRALRGSSAGRSRSARPTPLRVPRSRKRCGAEDPQRPPGNPASRARRLPQLRPEPGARPCSATSGTSSTWLCCAGATALAGRGAPAPQGPC
eukprot:TRINITY_DN5199_c0_g1_i3.p1 TRINITY_DN5199_c0_g1~~TRINITY_DN5199_c0_g1_i3.p1  ORF type:complete len:277 (+),score=18.62 TRINITY_DN5199_c0_g1_i3:65-895(+)